jgi:glycosyltransferase involved in cell wall biosynthesis
VDATSLPPERLGAGHYVIGLVEGLARAGVELHVVAKQKDADDVRSRAPGARVHTAGLRTRPSRLVWEQSVLPLRVRRLSPDVFHGPHYTLPPQLPCASVVTFHDPTFFTNPELHERTKVAYFTRMARVGVRRAARVIAVSQYAARGAAEHCGARSDRIDVIHHGIDLSRYAPASNEQDEKLRHGLGITGPYVLWLGAIEPRKDVGSLVRAFARLARDGAAHELVLAGPRAWGAAELDQEAAGSGLGSRIHRPGYVSEDEKIALYRGADVFAYPSIAEGFGLQVLEAMACGCPVVTTTGSAPEEVGAGAVRLVEPRDASALCAALSAVLDDAVEAAAMRERGLARAHEFSWDRAAAATIATYRRALA